MMDKIIVQISAGRGPSECCWVVARLHDFFIEKSMQQKWIHTVVTKVPAREKNTLYSSLFSLEGEGVKAFIKNWEGSILWIGKSPFRKNHKRKNWFVNLSVFKPEKKVLQKEAAFRFQPMRSSGPGGQHANKNATAVKAIHLPSGLTSVSQDTRSLAQNKKLAKKRLSETLAALEIQEWAAQKTNRWSQHTSLERGNPIQVFKGEKFKLFDNEAN